MFNATDNGPPVCVDKQFRLHNNFSTHSKWNTCFRSHFRANGTLWLAHIQPVCNNALFEIITFFFVLSIHRDLNTFYLSIKWHTHFHSVRNCLLDSVICHFFFWTRSGSFPWLMWRAFKLRRYCEDIRIQWCEIFLIWNELHPNWVQLHWPSIRNELKGLTFSFEICSVQYSLFRYWFEIENHSAKPTRIRQSLRLENCTNIESRMGNERSRGYIASTLRTIQI